MIESLNDNSVHGKPSQIRETCSVTPSNMRLFVLVVLTAIFLISIDSQLHAAQPRSNSLPQDILQTWQKAGAEVGWMGTDDEGDLRFQTDPAELTDVLPAFRFDRWETALLAKLPNPTQPFALSLPNRFDDAGLKEAARFGSLQSLSLYRSRISDEGLKQLAAMDNLRSLNLGHTEVTDGGMTHLSELNRLKNLDLDHTQVTGTGADTVGTTGPKLRRGNRRRASGVGETHQLAAIDSDGDRRIRYRSKVVVWLEESAAS